jgi:integrase
LDGIFGTHTMNITAEFEIATLAGAIDRRYRAFPLVACYTALRASELFGLRWRNVHFDDSFVEIVTTTIEADGMFEEDQPPKSNAGRRKVPLSAIAKQALLEHHRAHPGGPDEYVFTAPRGGPMRLGKFRKRFWYKGVATAKINAAHPYQSLDLRWYRCGAGFNICRTHLRVFHARYIRPPIPS